MRPARQNYNPNCNPNPAISLLWGFIWGDSYKGEKTHIHTGWCRDAYVVPALTCELTYSQHSWRAAYFHQWPLQTFTSPPYVSYLEPLTLSTGASLCIKTTEVEGGGNGCIVCSWFFVFCFFLKSFWRAIKNRESMVKKFTDSWITSKTK